MWEHCSVFELQSISVLIYQCNTILDPLTSGNIEIQLFTLMPVFKLTTFVCIRGIQLDVLVWVCIVEWLIKLINMCITLHTYLFVVRVFSLDLSFLGMILVFALE